MDLISFFYQSKDREEDDGFTAGDDDDFFGYCVYPVGLAHVLSNRLAQLRQTG